MKIKNLEFLSNANLLKRKQIKMQYLIKIKYNVYDEFDDFIMRV